VGFIILAFVSAAALPSIHIPLPDPTFLVAGLAILLLVVLWRRQLGLVAVRGQTWLGTFSAGQRLLSALKTMWRGMKSSFTPRQFVAGLTLTALARIVDGLVLLFAAQMLGVTLALPVAIFVIAASGFAGGVSLLPGGAGAAETAMAGLLVFSGAPFANALAITLLARMSTLWLWVGLGLGLSLVLQLAPARVPCPARVLSSTIR
jgi:uncharacterized protein (TIRG00374 family)